MFIFDVMKTEIGIAMSSEHNEYSTEKQWSTGTPVPDWSPARTGCSSPDPSNLTKQSFNDKLWRMEFFQPKRKKRKNEKLTKKA
uniref:Uncharacterized protein n=1 Tax=Romanomermis culicivorax TaxID=13658 RepID=A0A915HJH8_ROMCU